MVRLRALVEMGRKICLRWNDLEVTVPPQPPSLLERARGCIRRSGDERLPNQEGRKILKKGTFDLYSDGVERLLCGREVLF